MLKIKQQLLDGLAAGLAELAPGAGARAVFESPKVAAHGDFATTVAMQLAKPLKLNPRQLAERLRALLLERPPTGNGCRTSTSPGPVSSTSASSPRPSSRSCTRC
jgi:arginyl-tRNA synthetase